MEGLRPPKLHATNVRQRMTRVIPFAKRAVSVRWREAALPVLHARTQELIQPRK